MENMKQNNFEPWFLSQNELAKKLGINAITLIRWRKTGMPYLKFRRRVFFEEHRVRDWMQQQHRLRNGAPNGQA